MKRKLAAAVLFCACSMFSLEARAGIAEATFTPQGSDTYPEIPASRVTIYVFKPDFKFKVIGVVEARGMAGGGGSLLDQIDITKLLEAPPGEKEDIALAMKALKDEAGKAGAEGVIILLSKQVRVAKNATERQIRAAAIRKIE